MGELNDSNITGQVERVVQTAQQLDEWQRQIAADLGVDAAETRIIIAHKIPEMPPAPEED
ncbi:hypothetical protein [Streptomyces griseoaurantiacus]|uniref:hypothetical protein n=1 Tax=Streptomyces griseoaurantiacus TaxID=68213 RepID=UPI003698C73E